ncbi:MAG: T9SS type A sorting domain-containing protein [Saprospiraceae bacterium]|nr:T9SS type A sorting domain-containing protein [Saprospiraceae bacterium]
MKIATKLIYISILLLSVCSMQETKAQIGWEKIYPQLDTTNSVYGEGIETLCETPDGGYILAAIPYPSIAVHRSRLIKINDTGNIQWIRNYPIAMTNWVLNIENVTNGYIIQGYNLDSLSTKKAYLQKIDFLGNQIWLKEFSTCAVSKAGQLTTDGGYIALGYNQTAFVDEVVLIKTDSLGNTDWTNTYYINSYPSSINSNHRVESVTQTNTGNYLVYGVTNNRKAFLLMLDSLGNYLWLKYYGTSTSYLEDLGKVKQTIDGGFVVASNDAVTAGATDAYIFKVDTAGTLEWEKRYGLPNGQDDYAADLDLTYDGGYIVTGYRIHNWNAGGVRIFLTKLDSVGNITWEREFAGDQEAGFYWKPYCVKQTQDNGYVIGGSKLGNIMVRNNMYLIKTDSLGHIYDNIIEGYVYSDMDSNCLVDSSEFRFEGWTILADGAKDFWASTDSNGFYSIRLDTGAYDLILSRPSPSLYTSSCTGDTLEIHIPTYGTTLDTSFAQSALVSSPLMDVSLSTPFIRRCFNTDYQVSYCNHGTINADSAYIEVSFDDYLTVLTSSFNHLDWTDLGNNSFRFDLGTVAVGECGSFPITIYVDCDSVVLGQTHCSEAHIYPDTTSLPPAWAGPMIEVEAECDGDSVIFSLTNTGSSMGTSLQYVVYEDNVLVRPGIFQLAAAQTQLVSILAANNSTYQIQAQQAVGIPSILSDSLVAIAIEGCQDSINTGFVTQFPNYDGSPFVDIDCQQNIGAYDPNDKRGFPKGYGPEHYIYANTDLEYHIRFQNTGTDTAFNVVIRDTISPYLDITTLQPMVSSHNYTWQVFGVNQQVVEFTFPNIMLVDSNTNEAGSHGFIRFKINQVTDNPLGTIINNNAAIYFDFNEPIITNTTFHEIGEDFIEIEISSSTKQEESTPEIYTKVYPNPFYDQATIEVEGYDPSKTLDLYIYDNLRRLLRHMTTENQHQFKLERRELNRGIYFYQIQEGSKTVDSGKIILR